MPLALCCDDPSEVRWRENFARSRVQPLPWGNTAPAQAATPESPEPVEYS
jgi:hypothetical protein